MSPEKDTGPARQIADALRADITEGRLAPGAKLPAVRTLAQQHGVSRNTAQKAVTILQAEGLVITRYGSGAYVKETHERRRVGKDRYARSRWSVTTVEAHRGEHPDGEPVVQQGSQDQTVSRVPADEETAAALGVELGAEVIERDRVISRNGQKTHTMTSYYRVEDVADTAIEDARPGIAGRGGGFAVLAERGLPPEEMTEDLFARMPTAEEVERLELPPGEPVVELHRVTRTADGRPIEYARGIHAASRFVWSYTFTIPD